MKLIGELTEALGNIKTLREDCCCRFARRAKKSATTADLLAKRWNRIFRDHTQAGIHPRDMSRMFAAAMPGIFGGAWGGGGDGPRRRPKEERK